MRQASPDPTPHLVLFVSPFRASLSDRIGGANTDLQEECEKNVTNADTLGWDNDPFGKIDTNPNILAQFWANLFLIPISIIVVWVAGYAMRPIDDDKPVEEAPKNQFGFGLETGGVN